MKKKISKKNERSRYLNSDFGLALSKLESLDLNLEFLSPTQSISLRLPREVRDSIRFTAVEKDIPYQALIKIWLTKKVKKVS